MIVPRLERVHRLYQDATDKTTLPWGGDLPEEAKPFFSPCALWTRLPGDTAGNIRMASEVCDRALMDYLGVFLDLAVASKPDAAKAGRAAAYQRAYSDYRVAKDPARGMLTRMHGPELTERLVREVLFDFAVDTRST
jgi:phycoerythrobilin:ferredoxin oxidoreductase